MAAKHVLNQDLFHGTGGAIEGGVVKPGTKNELSYGAYGTTGLITAQHHARIKAYNENRLFGTVYKVRPVSETPKVRDVGPEKYVIDPKGLEVEEAVDYPINVDALHKRPSRWEAAEAVRRLRGQ